VFCSVLQCVAVCCSVLQCVCRVFCPIQARLYRTIVGSVIAVSCPLFGAPCLLTYILASPSDQPRADSLEFLRFLPAFFGKVVIFDNTEALVMSLLQRIHWCQQDRRASCLVWGRSCVEVPKERSTAHARQEGAA